jgi:4-hydroxybenzoate polyprenyltransferase and related prenyltransferases
VTRNETLTSGFLLAHYLFPIALGLSFSLVMHRATGLPLSAAGMVLFIAGIGCAYSLDRLIDKPAIPYPRWVFLALVATFATAALAGLVAAVCLPVKTLSATLIFAAASLFYRRLKHYPTAKTILVAVVWTWAGAALPITNHHWAAWDWWSISVSCPLILLMSAGCILCDLKDTEVDRQSGVRSLPVVLGANSATFIAVALRPDGRGHRLVGGPYGSFLQRLSACGGGPVSARSVATGYWPPPRRCDFEPARFIDSNPHGLARLVCS